MTLTKNDLWWNQIYWWYRGVLKRFIRFIGLATILFIVLEIYDIKSAAIIAFGGMIGGFVLSYPIDLLFFCIRNIWISKRHKDILFQTYTTYFSEKDYTTTYEDGSHTVPYNHFEKVYFYKRHIILKPVGMGNFFQLIKWQNVPEHQRQDLRDLLTAKILKADKS